MKVAQSHPTLCDSMGYTVHGILQARILERVAFPFSRGIFPTQGSNAGLPHCRQIFLPAEPQGKPKNTGVGSLSLFQWIFLTQELNQGLLHCRRILYQLSYQVWCACSDSPKPHGLQPTRLPCPWDFPGKNTGVGSLSPSRGSS